MPSAKKAAKQEPIENIKVKLKTKFGVKPRVYVPAAWILLILMVVFLFLVLPGIRKNGTYLTVHSLPPDAEVLFEGVRLGPSGVEVFAEKGTGTLTVRKAGYKDSVQQVEIKGRIFASRLFHRKEALAVNLDPESSYNPVDHGIFEFSSWASTGPDGGLDGVLPAPPWPSEVRYAIPSSLTEAAREAAAAGVSADGPFFAGAVLSSSIDERHLSDIFRAEAFMVSGGAVSVFSLEELAVRIAADLDRNPGITGGLARLSNEDRLANLGMEELSDEYPGRSLQAEEALEEYYADVPRSTSLSYGPYSFVSVPGQDAPVGDIEVVQAGYDFRTGNRPSFVTVSGFSISSREVSNSEYAVFLSENPEWALENIEALIKNGLADEAYLDDWTIAGPATGTDKLPVVGISWYAAAAYADWFSDKYLQGSGYTAYLPAEYEWEIAGRLNNIADETNDLPANLQMTDNADGGRLGILGMAGNVREWCRDPFAYNAVLFPGYTDDDAEFSSRVIRGGAYIDSRLSYPASARGSLPPATASPVVGFRLVIK